MARPPKRPSRTVRFELLLTPQEKRWLDRMAAEQGVSAADVLRGLVRAQQRPSGTIT